MSECHRHNLWWRDYSNKLRAADAGMVYRALTFYHNLHKVKSVTIDMEATNHTLVISLKSMCCAIPVVSLARWGPIASHSLGFAKYMDPKFPLPLAESKETGP